MDEKHKLMVVDSVRSDLNYVVELAMKYENINMSWYDIDIANKAAELRRLLTGKIIELNKVK